MHFLPQPLFNIVQKESPNLCVLLCVLWLEVTLRYFLYELIAYALVSTITILYFFELFFMVDLDSFIQNQTQYRGLLTLCSFVTIFYRVRTGRKQPCHCWQGIWLMILKGTPRIKNKSGWPVPGFSLLTSRFWGEHSNPDMGSFTTILETVVSFISIAYSPLL